MVAATAAAPKRKAKKATKDPVRLYSRGVVLGFKRSRANQYESCPLVRIEGVNTRKDAEFYAGKRVAYVYKGTTVKNGHKYRIVWGKVRRPHGNNGVVRTKFAKNLPPQSFGRRVRVFMYPSNI